MLGWSSEAASFDSRRNRSWRSSGSPIAGASSFSAAVPAEPDVLGAVDDARPAAPERLDDPVAPDDRLEAPVDALIEGHAH